MAKGAFSDEAFGWLILIEVKKTETVGTTFVK